MQSINAILTKIITASISIKFAAITITLIITLLISYNFNISPLQTQLQKILTQQAENKLQIQNINQEIQKLKMGIHKESKQKQQHSINSISEGALLKNITTALSSSQLTAIAIKPEIEADKTATNKQHDFTPPITIQNFSITAIGTYKQITDFLLATNNTNILSNVVSFSIKSLNNENQSTNTENKLLFNVSLETLGITHTKQVNKITIIRDPFNYETNKLSIPLTTWESKYLQFLGTIQQNNKTFGIISDPVGKLHYITVGTRIGINKNKITNITDTAIITENNQDNIYRNSVTTE